MKKKLLKQKTKIDKLRKKIIKFIKYNKWIIPMFISFYILDATTIFINNPNNFFSLVSIVPFIFSFIWIGLFISICYCIKKPNAIIFYVVMMLLSYLMFVVHNVYYTFFKMFFDFSLLGYASEGSPYVLKAIFDIKLWNIIVLIISVLLMVYSIKQMKHHHGNRDYRLLLKIIVIFIIVHTIAPVLLGSATKELEWDAWRNKRNIYNSFMDSNKSMVVSGFYEYNFRNLYVTYFKKLAEISSDDLTLLQDKFQDYKSDYLNEYTGVFDGKNLIIVQMEGIDNFLVTPDIMPNAYEIMSKSINFTNHYSFVSGGGSTFNSEFMVNTGYSTPYTYNQNAYSFSKNNFEHSLPNIFRTAGYTANAFHMNTAEYYSRGVNYLNFGYEKYYGLKSQTTYKDNSYVLDSELINNPEFNLNIFNKNQKFLDYIITYSTHMPFQSDKGVCKKLITDTTVKYSEFDCLKLQAKETDNMIKLLFDNLREKELIDNTVVVFFADHYLYTLSDPTLLDKFKTTSNNLINQTPFFIWSNNIKPTKVNKVNSQLNILPTILNMFGVEYRPNYYLMSDIFDSSFPGYVFFPDMSWYDGTNYVKEENIIMGNPQYDYIQLMNYNINKTIKINDAVLRSNYFHLLKK